MSTSRATSAGLVPDTLEYVAIRRNIWLSSAVAGVAALVGLAYLLRGTGTLDIAVGVVLVVLAGVHGAGLMSARTPVIVADEHGVRLRIGLAWRGLPWGSVRQVVVEHGDVVLREGRLVVVPRDPASTLDYLGPLGRLHLRWNELWYGAPLSVPLGMTTLTDSADLAAELTALADGQTDVVQLRGRRRARLDEVPTRAADEVDAGAGEDEVSGAVETDAQSLPGPAVPELPEPREPELPEPVAPLRAVRHPARAEVLLDQPAIADRESGGTEELLGHVPAQRQPGELSTPLEVPDLVHAEAWEEVPVEVEAADLAVRGPEPVIGPKIAHARDMLDMGVEELSQRTRIRPHVLEAIEVDDFGPCGGDFYARGHLTAIARVLGLDVVALMATYDGRYAHGPINARRVFEAELATGLSGGIRATPGGPRWTLLIGAVLSLTMIWGAARLVAGDPEQLTAAPPSSSESAGLAGNRQPITSPLMRTTPMTVTAEHAGAHVVVRDRTGRILWSGDLPMGKHRKVVGLAPFKVEADNAGAVEVTVDGQARGTLGTAGEAASKRFR